MEHPSRSDTPPGRVEAVGKLLHVGGERFWVKGVTYGTFAPDSMNRQFPPAGQIAADFSLMRQAGINTVRTYTPPSEQLLDLAAAHDLRVIVGLAWSQHVAFLDERRTASAIRREIRTHVDTLASHPAVLMVALGNEIPANVVRWLGQRRVERFLWTLYDDAKAIAPDTLFTYVNYPPTEYLNLPFVDVVAFNVYLHDEHALKSYLARLQIIAGHAPLLVAEAGADSIREGLDGQAALTSLQLRSAFAAGACGAVAFAFTDEWWRGGHDIDDWAFGLVDSERHRKPAYDAVACAFADVPFSEAAQRTWPRVSVIVCACNAAETIDECLASLTRLTYPSFDVIVVNDGSRDDTGERARRYAGVTVLDLDHAGLSAARNAGLEAATGEILAYLDADASADPDWLTFLVQPFLTSAVVAAGGPNVVPPHDPWMAQCVARAPGGPTHVLLDDRTAEHVPGCNLAVLRNALLAIGGFNPIYVRAGDDVDVCWRLQARGWKVGFSPAALVWHHHRSTVRAYWRQQVGYGEGQAWLVPRHPDKFVGRTIAWRGHIYSPLPFVRALSRPRVNTGVWGTAAFPSVYHVGAYPLTYLPHTIRWQLASSMAVVAGLVAAVALGSVSALILAVLGLVGLGCTATLCLRYALASNIEGLPPIGRWSPGLSRLLYRGTIAGLHLVQPFARARGQLRGVFSPVRATRPPEGAAPRIAVPTLACVWRAVQLCARGTFEARFWSERWITGDLLLTRLTERLRRSPFTAALEIDDGWQAGRDVRVAAGRLVRLDMRVLVEEHGAGRHLVRVAQRLRVTPAAIVALLACVGVLAVSLQSEAMRLVPAVAGVSGAVAVLLALRMAWRAASALAEADRLTAELMGDLGMYAMPSGPSRRRPVTADVAVDDRHPTPQEEAPWSA